MRTPVYPSPQEMASALLRESIRHLNDAYALIDAARYPAAIASAHKAQELAVKAALIQENTMGVYERLFKTHKPLSTSPAK